MFLLGGWDDGFCGEGRCGSGVGGIDVLVWGVRVEDWGCDCGFWLLVYVGIGDVF